MPSLFARETKPAASIKPTSNGLFFRYMRWMESKGTSLLDQQSSVKTLPFQSTLQQSPFRSPAPFWSSIDISKTPTLSKIIFSKQPHIQPLFFHQHRQPLTRSSHIVLLIIPNIRCGFSHCRRWFLHVIMVLSCAITFSTWSILFSSWLMMFSSCSMIFY